MKRYRFAEYSWRYKKKRSTPFENARCLWWSWIDRSWLLFVEFGSLRSCCGGEKVEKLRRRDGVECWSIKCGRLAITSLFPNSDGWYHCSRVNCCHCCFYRKNRIFHNGNLSTSPTSATTDLVDLREVHEEARSTLLHCPVRVSLWRSTCVFRLETVHSMQFIQVLKMKQPTITMFFQDQNIFSKPQMIPDY